MCILPESNGKIMALKLPKIVHLCNFFADLSKKSKSKAIYLYPSKRLHQDLLESSTFYRGLSYNSRGIED